jgi:hypothetical protein
MPLLIKLMQVLILETQEKEDKVSGLPYTCFPKRDVKPICKTCTNTVAHTDRLIRLHGELQSSLELIQIIVQHEKLKHESAHVSVDILDYKLSFELELNCFFNQLLGAHLRPTVDVHPPSAGEEYDR